MLGQESEGRGQVTAGPSWELLQMLKAGDGVRTAEKRRQLHGMHRYSDDSSLRGDTTHSKEMRPGRDGKRAGVNLRSLHQEEKMHHRFLTTPGKKTCFSFFFIY